MPLETIYALEASNVAVSGGGQLSGITQGDGSHLLGLTLTLLSNDWVTVLISDNDPSFSDNDGSQRLEGAQTFDGVTYAGNRRVEAEFGITVEDPDGVVYQLLAFNINEPGVRSYATVEGLAFIGGAGGFPPINVPLTVTGAQEGPSYGDEVLATPICFTEGALIETAAGPKAVETLEPGDLFDTLDHGLQPLRWIGRVRLPACALKQNPHFRPVRLHKDALGPGLPARDLAVSPQHRVLVRGWRAELFFGEAEILVPAHKLVNSTTIDRAPADESVTYVHLLFDRHEIVFADGLPSESFFLGGKAPAGAATRREVMHLFPELARRETAFTAARPLVSGRDAAALATLY